MSLNLQRIFFTSFLAFTVGGCTLPGMSLDTDSPEDIGYDNVKLIELNALTAAERPPQVKQEKVFTSLASASRAGDGTVYDYLVGPHDVLDITVWGRPELNNPGGMTQTAESRGRKVRSDGTIFFPFAGTLEVEDKTIEAIRRELVSKLSRYINEPQIDVKVAIPRARRFYVTGEVEKPGIQFLGVEPISLMDAINMAGGLTKAADHTVAYVTRFNERHPIDINAMYAKGEMVDNILLQDKDTVHIADNRRNRIFVMGEVAKQGSINMHKGQLTLAEALAEAEGIDLEYADAAGLFVIRRMPLRKSEMKVSELGDQHEYGVNIYRLDASSPDAILVADQFALAPRDVVFISTTTLTRWNRVISQILPTVQTIFQTDSVIQRR